MLPRARAAVAAASASCARQSGRQSALITASYATLLTEAHVPAPTSAFARFCTRMPLLAQPSVLSAALAANGVRVDLRSAEEKAAIPPPTGSIEWDFNAEPDRMPLEALPADKSTPLVLF